MYMWVGAGGFSNVMATLNHVGGSFNLFMATTLNLGFCAVCWAHFVFHYKLWPTSVSHPSSVLNSSLGLAGRNHYQKTTILVFRVVLQKFCYSRLLSLYSFLSLYSLLIVFRFVCYCSTVMSLLEAPCAKTSWKALLFRAILGITGALTACFVMWWFKQVNNRGTGFGGHHCDFEQHVSCLTVHVCMNSVKLILEAPSASILRECYYSMTMCRLIWGALLFGRALLIGTLGYVALFQSGNWLNN